MGGIGGVGCGVVVHQHELPDIEQQLHFTDVALYAQVPSKARVDCQIDDDSLRSRVSGLGANNLGGCDGKSEHDSRRMGGEGEGG